MGGRKSLMFAGFLLCLVFVCGCETCVGAAKGTACAAGSTVVGVAKDAKNTHNFIIATDEWMKKNMW